MSIEQRIEHFITDDLLLGNGQAGIAADESLISSGVLDSLALLRLIMFLEEEFGVTIEDGEVIPDNFETISAMNAFLRKKQQSR